MNAPKIAGIETEYGIIVMGADKSESSQDCEILVTLPNPLGGTQTDQASY